MALSDPRPEPITAPEDVQALITEHTMPKAYVQLSRQFIFLSEGLLISEDPCGSTAQPGHHAHREYEGYTICDYTMTFWKAV